MTGQAKTNICKIEPFIVPIKYGWKTYRLLVQQISLDERKEQFMIGTKRKHVIVQTNRPLFRIRGIKHRKPTILQLTTGVYQGNHMDELMKKIITHVDEQIKYL